MPVSTLSRITIWLFVTSVSKSSGLLGRGVTLYFEPNRIIPIRLNVEVLPLPFSPTATSKTFVGIIDSKKVLKNHTRTSVLNSSAVKVPVSVSMFIESAIYLSK